MSKIFSLDSSETSNIFNSISVKPNEQSKVLLCYVMARKCIKLNI